MKDFWVNDNGIKRKASAEEIAQAERDKNLYPEILLEDRVSDIELMLADLIGGAV